MASTGRREPRLPIVAQPGARWRCHGCGHCCHHFVVELTDEEAARIDRALYADVLDGDFSVMDRPFGEERRVLRHRADGACVFLAADGGCLVHRRQGPAAKPNACQLFPFAFVSEPSGPIRAGLRSSCRTAGRSVFTGPELASYQADLERLARDTGAVGELPAHVRAFERVHTLASFEAFAAAVFERLAVRGPTPLALMNVDRELLGSRLLAGRPRYAIRLLAHAEDERRRGSPPGSFAWLLDQVPGGARALGRLRDGHLVPAKVRRDARDAVMESLRRALFLGGPYYANDAGVGLLSLVLALEATLHALGRSGSVELAMSAFDVFASPLLETEIHFRPVEDALGPRPPDARPPPV